MTSDKWDGQPHSIVALRMCQHWFNINYRATLESTDPHAVAALVRQLQSAGLCFDHRQNEQFFGGEMSDNPSGPPDYYAVLDHIGENSSWCANLTIPTKAEFDKLREALALRIISSDCGHGCR